MKRFLLLILLLDFLVVGLLAQSANNQDEVCKIDQNAARAYRQGELIVKFNPKKRIRVATSSAVEGSNSVNSIFEKMGVENIEQLMPLSNEVQSRNLRSVHGGTVNANDMSQLYRVEFSNDTLNVHQVAEELGELEEVEFAEPNYLVYTLSTGESTEADSYEAEPLMKDQWALNAVNIKHVWTQKKVTDKRPVIAILDTGVDITHPDLEGNIWTNEAEANGVEDEDDDNNGYEDDIHGYDFVNKTARIGDWNGHGTHCAGIAAADGKNGKGIAGANPDALIMPVTVMQSDGTGDVATIIKGIDYAAANGADVISMSIGGYGYSIAEEQALGRAYNTAVLVAAAGNDGICIDPMYCSNGKPMFPAAFTFVLGVEAADKSGYLASFSNYDPDGPTLSNPLSFTEEQLYNYELRAPGLAITSTYPGGRYKALNGTSMACPLVAGGISRLLQCKPYPNKELLFADLIHARKKSSSDIVDFKATYNITDADRIPVLQWVTYALKDSIGGDNDLRPDAGETIEIYPILKTVWGQAENIKLSIALPDTEDPTIVEFINNNVSFGKNLNSYAKARSENPLCFKINDNCADGRHIRLVLRATCDATDQVLEEELVLIAENGVEIGGLIDKDLTLYPNVHYIVTKPLAVPDGVTLTIKPGTVLKFKENTGFSSSAKDRIICNGTPDSMIVFTQADHSSGRISTNTAFTFNNDTLSYVSIQNLNTHEILSVEPYSLDKFMHIEIKNNTCDYVFDRVFSGATFVNILGNSVRIRIFEFGYNIPKNGDHFNVSGNRMDSEIPHSGYSFSYSNIYEPISCDLSTPQLYTPAPNYYGSTKEKIIRQKVYDIEHPTKPTGYAKYDLSNMLTRPSAEAHGIVWKVLVNGYDAQDEFDRLPPLGVGKHKFEVYFNRPMNKEVVPFVAMGVRPPYTQKTIAEDGAWNEDGTIYTAYLTIDGKTGIDGLNRIYVSGAEDDEHFEIPIEDQRFNVEVAAAGSMATGLMAEPGLGKVSLTWETDEEDFADLLGYNIYRHTAKLDSIYVKDYNKYGDYQEHLEVTGDTVIVNSTVIDSEENAFVDYSVVPGTTYYYAIKQLTTSLTSHALSNEVAATPLTATKGDANGSMSVDVADVVTEIAYLTNQNPQPFIFEAADVNADNTVNILDVVGTVNIIITPQAASMSANSSATYSIEDGILYVETPVALGGVQVQLSGKSGDEFTAMPALDAFERVGVWNTETDYLFMAYSMSGKTLLPGKHALLRINHADVDAVVLSDVLGKNVVAIDGNITGIGAIEAIQIRTPYPSPFNTELHIPYVIGKDGIHRVDIVITDLMGRTVHEYSVQNDFGQYEYVWSPNNILSNGIYVISLYADDVLMQSTKVIYNR